MQFDLEAALERINRELEDMVAQYWDIFNNEIHDIAKEFYRTTIEKARHIEQNIRVLPKHDQIRFRVLLYIVLGRYWHTVEYWDDFIDGMTEEDRDFYAQTLLGVAMNQSRTEDGPKGFCWIVVCYDQGFLREHIDDNMLITAVNEGFFELAANFFTKSRRGGLVMNEKYYSPIMVNYAHLLDLEIMNKLKDTNKPLFWGYPWVSKQYIELVKRDADKLSLDDGAYFARPVIDLHLMYCTVGYEYDNKNIDPAKELAKRLAPYNQFLTCATIQDLLLFRLKEHIDGARLGYSETDWLHLQAIPIIISYLAMNETDLQVLLSEGIEFENSHQVLELANSDLSADLFSQELRNKCREVLETFLPVEALKHVKKGQPLGLLHQTVEAMKSGWLAEKWTREYIVEKLETYLSKKRAPTPSDAQHLVNNITFDLVGDDLFCRVVERCLVSFGRSNREDFKELKLYWEGRLRRIRQAKAEREEARAAEFLKFPQLTLDI